jgi:hypothetical protein
MFEEARMSRTLASLLAVISLTCCTFDAQSKDLSDTVTRATLARPSPFTNVVYSSRAISPDGKTLHSARYWLSGMRIHILSEEVPNELNASSLEDIPEAIWTKGHFTFELIKNDDGTFIRTKRPTDWREMIERDKREFTSKVNEGELHILDPEAWQEMQEADSWLYKYALTVDADQDLKNSLSTPGMTSERGRLAFLRDDPKHSLGWELIFDPATGMKQIERRWAGDHLILQGQWNTTQAIAVAQFQIPDRDLEAWRGRFGEKAGGLGLVLKSGEPMGPFSVSGVLSNSPAAVAQIEPGSVLIAIEGHTTEGMQKATAVDLIRGLPGTRVTIEIEDPRTQEKRTLELKRQILVRTAVQATGNRR